MLPVAFLSPAALLTGAGGFAAAIAIGAFFGQVFSVVFSATEDERREFIAAGGLIGLLAMIGFILLSAKLA